MIKKKLPENEESKVETIQPIEEEEKKFPEEVPRGVRTKKAFDFESWKPKTELGKLVKEGKITLIDEILNKGLRVLEPEITDALVPDLESDLITIGQSKGKFGGGKRSIWRQTQKKTQEGNKPKFSTLVVVGNKKGYVGIGYGKSKETVPAREKALRKAKLNFIKIKRGCGSWQCDCCTEHSLPFKVKGKCSSVIVELLPAPKGTGLVVERECKKILTFAGFRDVYSNTTGTTRTKLNLVKACFKALQQLSKIKVKT